MKKIGILGGLGPEATMDYYREIISAWNRRLTNGELNYPEIIIFSVTMAKFIGWLEKQQYGRAVDYLVACLNRLKEAGADFAVISANTPHLLFDEINAKSNLPLLSIVERCAQKAVKMNIRRCALLGTKFTMQSDFYQKVFNRYNIEIYVPREKEIELIHERLFKELELGIFKEDTRQEILAIVRNLKEKREIEAVILGCTEFPLMFQEQDYLGLPFLNTSKLHVEAIVEECFK